VLDVDDRLVELERSGGSSVATMLKRDKDRAAKVNSGATAAAQIRGEKKTTRFGTTGAFGTITAACNNSPPWVRIWCVSKSWLRFVGDVTIMAKTPNKMQLP
jgi:hypothetical protein